VYTWTWDTYLDKLKQVYEKADVDKTKVKIFSVKPAPEKLKAGGMVKQARQTPQVNPVETPVEPPQVRQERHVEHETAETFEEVAGEEGGPIVKPVIEAVVKDQPSEPASPAQQEQTPMSRIPITEPVEKGGTSCTSGCVEFKLSDGRVVCVQRDLAGVLRVFAERGYRVEASKSRIVVYDKQGEEVFSSTI
jgi:hypothetical protein